MNRLKPAAALLFGLLMLAFLFCTILPVSAITESDASFDTTVSILRSSDRSLLAAASDSSPAELKASDAAGILLSDAISYRELAPESEGYYIVTMTLCRIETDGRITPIQTSEPTRQTAVLGQGSWTMELSRSSLDPGTYVIYERAEMQRLQGDGSYQHDPNFDVAHEDPADVSQQLIIRNDALLPVTTEIMADLHVGSAASPVRLTAAEAEAVAILDCIHVDGLDPVKPYTVERELHDVTRPEESFVFTPYETCEWDWDRRSSSAIVTMRLRFGTGPLHLKPGHVYAAYVTIRSNGAIIAEHRDDLDPAERIEVETVPTEVLLRKIDESGRPLAGAGLLLTQDDPDGTEIDAWTSGAQDHVLTLAPGTYCLQETAAPGGYQKTDPIYFQVTALQEVLRKDSRNWIGLPDRLILLKNLPTAPKPTPTPASTPTPTPPVPTPSPSASPSPTPSASSSPAPKPTPTPSSSPSPTPSPKTTPAPTPAPTPKPQKPTPKKPGPAQVIHYIVPNTADR